MLYKAGDIIDVKGSAGYIDFCGKIEIINIVAIEEATSYQEDFFYWWFGEEDGYYLECKRKIKEVYIGKLIEDNHLGKRGSVIAFAEQFLETEGTKKILSY